MSTKAERFRYEAERSGPKKRPKPPPKPKRDAVIDTSLPGVSASDRRAAKPRNVSDHAGKKAAYILETSATKPSRKSTRRAANRLKNDSQMRVKRSVAEGKPPPR
jgi:hypothetical protein